MNNKYFYVGIIFFLWMSFFDANSFITYWHFRKVYKKLKFEKIYLENKVFKKRLLLKKIYKDPNFLEKKAREYFYAKKNNEDIFIIK